MIRAALTHYKSPRTSRATPLGLMRESVQQRVDPERVPAAGYRAAFVGERTYNGVAILTRDPLDDVRMEFPLEENSDCRLISGVYNGIRVYSAYFPNGR